MLEQGPSNGTREMRRSAVKNCLRFTNRLEVAKRIESASLLPLSHDGWLHRKRDQSVVFCCAVEQFSLSLRRGPG